MDDGSLRQLVLRAFDQSERSVRRGRDLGREGLTRWRARLWMILQCGLTAGLAWFVAGLIPGNDQPVFAPVAAMLCLGSSFGQRVSRAFEVAIGVAIGVFLGDVFVAVFGTGTWQIILVVIVAMSAATLLGARNLMITQAGVQSVVVLALLPAPDQTYSRWTDALIGCALALIVTMVAPVSSIAKPRVMAAGVLLECAQTLRACADALTKADPALAEKVLTRARATTLQLSKLAGATDEGVAVVRYSPFLRGSKEHMQGLADLVKPLDRMNRNLRVLARRSIVALFREEEVPAAYLALMIKLADEIEWCADELSARRLPTAGTDRVMALGEDSSHLPVVESLSAMVILGQLRAIMGDVLELAGMEYAEALEVIPNME